MGLWFFISGNTLQDLFLVESLEMLHIDSLSIPYRQRLTLLATATASARIMDLLNLIPHQWVIDNQCLPMVMNHGQATMQSHLAMLSLLHNNTPHLVNNQILTKKVTIIITLDHIIMKEITIRGTETNHQEIIKMLVIIVMKLVTTAETTRVGTGSMAIIH